MKFMNNKAVADTLVVWTCGALMLSVSAFFLRHSHRERKAVELCVTSGHDLDVCQEIVSHMSREDILEYIKDDDVAGNQGNFVGGMMIEEQENSLIDISDIVKN